MSTRCLRLIPVFCLFVFSGQAQQSEPANRRITLDVMVTDKSGKPVPGLQQQDFTLLDNKLPQKILSFQEVAPGSTQEPPTEVILLIDTVNTGFSSVSYERSQIVKYLQQNGGKVAHPTSLIFFSDQDSQVQTRPTQDSAAL